jgi:hypothetical protein
VRKAAAPPSKLEGKYDPSTEATPSDDFSVSASGGEAPKEELKRPSF